MASQHISDVLNFGRGCYAKILTLAIVVVLAMAAAPSAQAQTYQLIHDFSGPDGAHPSALVMDAAGHLYGATQNGGAGAACWPSFSE